MLLLSVDPGQTSGGVLVYCHSRAPAPTDIMLARVAETKDYDSASVLDELLVGFTPDPELGDHVLMETGPMARAHSKLSVAMGRTRERAQQLGLDVVGLAPSAWKPIAKKLFAETRCPLLDPRHWWYNVDEQLAYKTRKGKLSDHQRDATLMAAVYLYTHFGVDWPKVGQQAVQRLLQRHEEHQTGEGS